jgi:hypothetical protein
MGVQTVLVDIGYNLGPGYGEDVGLTAFKFYQDAVALEPTNPTSYTSQLENLYDDMMNVTMSTSYQMQMRRIHNDAVHEIQPLLPAAYAYNPPTVVQGSSVDANDTAFQFAAALGVTYALGPQDTPVAADAPSIAHSGVAISSGVLNLDQIASAASTPYTYTLTEDAGFPLISSLVLPGEGTCAFAVSYEAGGIWSGPTIEQSAQREAFPSGVEGLAVTPLDANDNATTLDPEFAFDFNVAFTTAGSFAGTVAQPSVACFAAGTRISTERGDVRVEALQAGERVITVRGRRSAHAVIWLGRRTAHCRRHPKPRDVWPVRVSADAFGAGQPHRDLWLSPDHAVFIDGVLIPIRYLLNGATIVQEPADAVTYWHVELPRHDILLAEGLACESYLDTGNRGAFENGGGATMLHPDFALRVWEKASCAELVLGGARLAAARSRVHERARALGFALTPDPDLHLVIGNRRVDAKLVAGGLHRFPLPGGVRELRIVSRAAVPAETDILAGDTRRLGVMLDQVMVRRPPGQRCEILLGELPADAGFHALEVDGARRWRWTDGHACLAIPNGYADGGRAVLDLHVAAVQPSWLHHGRPATVPGEARKAA